MKLANKGMSDLQTFGIIIVAVAVVAIVLYVWDRRTKQEQIDWSTAGKLAAGAGGLAGGVLYAVGDDAVETVVEATTSVVNAAQDMFVGKPAF